MGVLMHAIVALAATFAVLSFDRHLGALVGFMCQKGMPIGVAVMENTAIPDAVLDPFIRLGVRVGVDAFAKSLQERYSADPDFLLAFHDDLRSKPIALLTDEANEQHYQVETQFYNHALGSRRKYSMAWYDENDSIADAAKKLDAAEIKMLEAYISRAGLESGQTILDLGCGWGSVSLYMAERFPGSSIIGASNSKTQKAFIMGEAEKRGLKNLEIRTLNVAGADGAAFFAEKQGAFDRVISIEMFEHMKNYTGLFELLNGVLKPGGFLFVHIFCHPLFGYHFEMDGFNDWMTEHFFKGGTMPSKDTLPRMLPYGGDLALKKQWMMNGRNYTLTAEAWLQRIDERKAEIAEVFGGDAAAALQVRRWRIFMITCAEFFGLKSGGEFLVSHYLFEKLK